MEHKSDFPFLSGNVLKIIAAISMLFDHIGVIFFPQIRIFRIVGRLAFPIFAFFIAEGCRYTRNRLRYFATIFGMAVLFQLVYGIVLKDFYMCVFVTFSLSILLIYLLDEVKRAFADPHATALTQGFWLLCFFAGLLLVYYLNEFLHIDYRFMGCLTPVFASLFNPPSNAPAFQKENKSLTNKANVLAMGIPLLTLYYTTYIPMQIYSLLALPLLLLYSGKRGKYKMKYFFYIFYPVHLVLLYGIAMFL